MPLLSPITDRIRRALRRVVRLHERLRNRWFDFTHGTDTASHVQLAELHIDHEHKSFGTAYQPTLPGAFRKLMKLVDLPRDGVFVDVGCGKGRVLLLAAEEGFGRVVGVEFSHELCEIARDNAEIFMKRGKGGAHIEVVESDAVAYEIKEDENVFFMFNAFDAEVMEKFLMSLARSFEQHPRKLWLIYHNPTCADAVEGLGIFQRTGEYTLTLFGDPFVVYVTTEEFP